MTRTEKWKHKRHKLKLESLVIEATYLQNKSEELVKQTEQVDSWWKDYRLMEDFKPK